MIPYATFTFFGLLLYAIVPTIVLGLLALANRRWALLITIVYLLVQYSAIQRFSGTTAIREIWILAAFGVWQWIVLIGYHRSGSDGGWSFYLAIALSVFPLVLTKTVPVIRPDREFGFLGISYVTFRALDLIFCLRDKVIEPPRVADFTGFLFFFPTISAGPIDRYRRFMGDWNKSRPRAEFTSDLDAAMHRIFRGFFYKFILAELIKYYWLDRVAAEPGFFARWSYMYAYSFYLFFDFAGYSAFAIALSYLFGVHTPENFERPFLARNIRDFWNRWHITLSFWFRDHVYMRFIFAAKRNRWIENRDSLAITGYFITFGLMGLWHGFEPHFILYGVYQATLLSAFHLFAEWRKERPGTVHHLVWRVTATVLTFHCVCFGFLIFSGHLAAIH